MIVLKMVKNLKKVEDYKERYISEAIKTGENSTIEGVIKKRYILPEGFSGIISNCSYEAFFYMSNKNIHTEEERGVFPLFLDELIKTEKTVQIKGYYNRKIGVFKVKSIEWYKGYKYDGFTHIIGSSD